MKLAALLISLPLFAAPIITIDCGTTPAEPYVSGGFAYTVQPSPSGDTTLRFGWAPAGQTVPPFSYAIPVPSDGAYQVDLNFLEPSSAPPARVFSVTINDQLVYPRLTMPGYLVPFTRSAIVISSGGFINIRFDTIIRGAVISSIVVSPFAVTTYIKPSDPKTALITGAVPVWTGDGYLVPRPAIEPDPTVLLTYQNVEVFQNGVRQLDAAQTAAGDYLILSSLGQLKLTPVGGQQWMTKDAAEQPVPATVTVNYQAIWPPAAQPVALNIIQRECARCHGADLKPGDLHLVNGLDLRRKAFMLLGGLHGPAIVPGNAEQSLLYKAISRPQFPTATPEETLALTTEDGYRPGMPPFFRLSPEKIAIIRDWLNAGAPE